MNKRLGELFYGVDRQPGVVIGFDGESRQFVNDSKYEISLEEFIRIC